MRVHQEVNIVYPFDIRLVEIPFQCSFDESFGELPVLLGQGDSSRFAGGDTLVVKGHEQLTEFLLDEVLVNQIHISTIDDLVI